MSILLRGKKSLSQLARAILKSFGSNASSYPFATRQGAYQTNAGPAAAAVNDPVGLELDAMGTRTDLTVSQDLTTWTSGGAFNNWAQSTATATTITAIGAYGSRYIRYACAPGNIVQFSAMVVAGNTPGLMSIVFGDAGLGYLEEASATSIASGAIAVGRVAPANTAFVEIIIRAVDAGGTVGFTGLSAFQATGNRATQTTAINRPTLQQDGGGRWYASFNGTNQSLPLASTLTAVAGTFICCARADVVHFGTLVGNGGSEVPEPGISLGTTNYGKLRAVFGNETITNQIISTVDTYTPGEIFVVSVQWDMSFIKVRKNSGTTVQVANTLGDLTSAMLGSIGRIGPLGGDYFSGSIYDAIAIKGVVPASQLLTLEKAAAQKAGLVL